MYIKFEDSTQLTLLERPSGNKMNLGGHKRDVLKVTVEGDYVAVKAAFNGQGWKIVDDEGVEFDKSNYTIVASICDNMNGTITVCVGRQNTVEETLRDENAALLEVNSALMAENDEQNEIISILAGEVTV